MDLNPALKNTTYDFDLQVWTPFPTVTETGRYRLVDSFFERSIHISPRLKFTAQVARVKPPPHEQLQFQPGDVLGFYVESYKSVTVEDDGVVLLDRAGHSRELVWYGWVTGKPGGGISESGSFYYETGINGVLNSSTRAAPVISVSLMTYPCSAIDVRTSSTYGSPNPSSTTVATHIYATPHPDNVTTITPDTSTRLAVGISAAMVIVIIIVLVSGVVILTALYCQIRRQHSKTRISSPVTQDNRHGSSCDVGTQTDHEVIYDYPDSSLVFALKSNEFYGDRAFKLEVNQAYAVPSNRDMETVVKSSV